MCRKLIKYDLRAVRSLWLIQALILLALAIPFSLGLRFVTSEHSDAVAVYEGLVSLFLFLCIVWFFVSAVLVSVLVYVHYYKNLFTDEGYLTFTLPVTRRQILLSKLATALILQGAQIVVYLVVAAVVLLLAPTPESGNLITLAGYKALGEFLGILWNELGAWLILYVVQGLLILVCYALFTTLTAYFCITIGSTVVRKGKLPLAIGIYYGIQSVLSFVLQINIFSAFTPFGVFSVTSVIMGLAQRLDAQNVYVGMAILLTIILMAILALAIILFCMTLDMLERKLNLA